MRFNSPIFWIFLLVVVAALAALPKSTRKAWLILVSYAFYASWHWPYVALLFACATFTYYGAMWIDAADGPARKRRGNAVILVNFVVLFLFKYLDWATGNVNNLGTLFGLTAVFSRLNWMLPLGISFYLFESSSYIFDVVKKREKVHSFWDVQLFITFFPKLIAGPIMRAKELVPQFAGRLTPTTQDIFDGVSLVISGLFMKIVIADSLAPDIDKAFARDPSALSSSDVMIMAVAFGLQIYFDFASYSRIAIGAARLCGLQLVQNFNFPFSAKSPVDFWNRWHISLSRWIRDYVYYPLVGGKVTLTNMCKATIIAMTLCGVWHGAGWKFVTWGLFHGLLIAGYQVYRFVTRKLGTAEPASLRGRLQGALAVLTFNAALLPTWLLFRASDVTNAARLTGTMLTPWRHMVRSLPGGFCLKVACLMLLVWGAPYCVKFMDLLGSESAPTVAPRRPAFFSAACGVTLGALLAFCLVLLRGKTTFIYFQF